MLVLLLLAIPAWAPAPASAARVIKPSSYRHGVFHFDLAGLQPGSIRSGRLLPGRRALPKSRLAAAARRGHLRVGARGFNPPPPSKLRFRHLRDYRLSLQLRPGGLGPDASHPVGLPGPWRLVFDDEFSGRQLDLSRWNPNWFGDPNDVTKPVNSAEDACYRPEHSFLAGGVLNQYADRYPNCATRTGQVYQAATGAITRHVSGPVASPAPGPPGGSTGTPGPATAKWTSSSPTATTPTGAPSTITT